MLDELLGGWRLIERDPVDSRERGRVARDRDVGMRVRFRLEDRRGLGVVDLELGQHTFVYGVWRASRAGLFLGSTGGYSPAEFDGATSRGGWLDEAVSFSADAGVVVLRDRAGQMVARFERRDPTLRPGSDAEQVGPAVGLPTGLVPLEGDQLVGAWQPVRLPTGGLQQAAERHGARFQNLEFTGQGWWTPFPRINIGSGRWLAGADGALLAVYPELGRTDKGLLGWVELDPWLLPVARAGFDGKLLVLLDDDNHELQRLRRLTDDRPVSDRG